MSTVSGSRFVKIIALVMFTAFCRVVDAQDFDKVQIASIKVADGIYMLKGYGGNVGVSAGDDGVLLIDNQFPQLADKIKAAVAQICRLPIRIVYNTNWHYDHADGNERFAQDGALVVAHENSRAHMLVEQRAPELDSAFKIAPYPKGALPVVTFHDSLTFHFNDDEIQAICLPNAHSDGDLVFRFKNANVIHTGDLFFPNAIPFINFSGGGSIEGMIHASDRILEMTDENTRVIPGHGAISNRDDVRSFRDLLATIRDRLIKLIVSGKTVDEAIASKVLADLYKGRRSYFHIDKLTRYGYLDLKRYHAKSQ